MVSRIGCVGLSCCVYFFLGCRSPATYEIIEVSNGEKMLDMHGCFRGGEAGQMPEVPATDRPWHRQDHNLAKTCRDNPAKGKAVFGAGELFYAVFNSTEATIARWHQEPPSTAGDRQ